jgi:hypothetical protein
VPSNTSLPPATEAGPSPDPATGTPAPPATATHLAPPATETPAPFSSPTPTATVETCSILSGSLQTRRDDDTLELRVQNNMASTVRLESAVIFWPQEPHSQELRKIEIDGRKVWSGKDEGSPSAIPSEGSWEGSSDERQIGPGSDRTLQFEFQEEPEDTGYMVTLNFDNGCAATASR